MWEHRIIAADILAQEIELAGKEGWELVTIHGGSGWLKRPLFPEVGSAGPWGEYTMREWQEIQNGTRAPISFPARP